MVAALPAHASRSCSRRPCRRRSSSSRGSFLRDPCRVEVTPAVTAPRADRAAGAFRRGSRQARAADALARGSGAGAGDRVHPHQARRGPRRRAPRCATRIDAEALHGNKSQSRTRAVARKVPVRTRPRAGRDRHRLARHRREAACRTWSISTCRWSRKATCTASAARRAPARRDRDRVLRAAPSGQRSARSNGLTGVKLATVGDGRPSRRPARRLARRAPRRHQGRPPQRRMRAAA